MQSLLNPSIDNKELYLPYTIGALLYSPANNESISNSIIMERFGSQYSLALCLEDSISDSSVNHAENILINTIKTIYEKQQFNIFYLPKIFIRVRKAEQMMRLYQSLGESAKILTGFIFPKFSSDVSTEFINELLKINKISYTKIYMMPILESNDIVDLNTRYHTLNQIKREIDNVKEYALNVRVGGNDFCKGFGIRRHMNETIYDIRCVSNILSDIITTFSKDYVVSGPVWEYFDSPNEEWKFGMEHEIQLDLINGFIGKTVIHPKQIPVLNNALKVEKKDYEDALSILNMEDNIVSYVEKSTMGERMNEYKTHKIWAKKTIILGNIYGVKEYANKWETVYQFGLSTDS